MFADGTPTRRPRLSTSHNTSTEPAERGFDPGVDVVALVVGDLDGELAGGMGHGDSYVHEP